MPRLLRALVFRREHLLGNAAVFEERTQTPGAVEDGVVGIIVGAEIIVITQDVLFHDLRRSSLAADGEETIEHGVVARDAVLRKARQLFVSHEFVAEHRQRFLALRYHHLCACAFEFFRSPANLRLLLQRQLRFFRIGAEAAIYRARALVCTQDEIALRVKAPLALDYDLARLEATILRGLNPESPPAL